MWVTCFAFRSRSHLCSNSPLDSLVLLHWLLYIQFLVFIIYCSVIFVIGILKSPPEYWSTVSMMAVHLPGSTSAKGENQKGLQGAEGDVSPWYLGTCLTVNCKGKRIHITYNQLQLYTWRCTVRWIMVVSADVTSSPKIVRRPPPPRIYRFSIFGL